jgi:uncharacterized surface protein with fasciclin (FAS1) repeats
MKNTMRSFVPFKSLSKLSAVAAALIVLPVAVACGGAQTDTVTEPDAAIETPVATETPDATATPGTTAATPAAGEGTLVEVATSNGSFTTLVAAIQAAGLESTLNGPGPYTVFAPTDAAFEALPAGTLDALLLPENKAVLTQILNYHVVSGNVPSSEVTTGAVPSVEGTDLDVTAEGGTVTVNGAEVTQPDVQASNGVIHVIDTVLIPESVDVSAL